MTGARTTGAELLAAASEVLAQSLAADGTVERVLRLAVPVLADWCVLECAEGEDAEVFRPCAVHAETEVESKLRSLADRTRGRGGLLDVTAQVLRTGKPAVREGISEDDLAGLASSEEVARELGTIGLRSVVVAPMVARRHVFGTLTLGVKDAARRLGPRLVDTATDLAHRIALALDNAQLFTRMQRAVRAREELLAVVSHDLRTPLSTVSLVGTKMAEEADAIRQHEGLLLLRNVRRMEHLLRDLLDFSHLESGRLRVEPGSERIATVVEQAVESAKGLLGSRSLRVEIDPRARELEIPCDRARVEQVIDNLLSNAAKYGGRRGLITVRLTLGPEEVVVSVGDTGPGISEDEIPTLFDAYRRGRNSGSTGRVRSLGLGLYIARALIEAHGGRIWVWSERERGSQFFFTLPRKRPDPKPRAENPREPILLVDDDASFRREATQRLREEGYTVESAVDGKSALEYLDGHAPPALILLDLVLPVMDGWILAKEIEKRPALTDVPVVVVSCLDRKMAGRRPLEVTGFLQKPVPVSQLLNVVRRHVGAPRRTPEKGAPCEQ